MKNLILTAAIVLLTASTAFAQYGYMGPVVVGPAPTVTYYAPAPVYYAPAPTVAYYPGAPVYVGPRVVWRAPLVVAAPVYAGPVWYGPRYYVPGQPVRNVFRAVAP